MKRALAALFAGGLFGLGLALARMTDPRVVLGFLDVAGAFDPSLAFVLGGAVGVGLVVVPLILRRSKPVLDARFKLPTRDIVDRPLVLGSALFGIGWGLAGYCPGARTGGLCRGCSFGLAAGAGDARRCAAVPLQRAPEFRFQGSGMGLA